MGRTGWNPGLLSPRLLLPIQMLTPQPQKAALCTNVMIQGLSGELGAGLRIPGNTGPVPVGPPSGTQEHLESMLPARLPSWRETEPGSRSETPGGFPQAPACSLLPSWHPFPWCSVTSLSDLESSFYNLSMAMSLVLGPNQLCSCSGSFTQLELNHCLGGIEFPIHNAILASYPGLKMLRFKVLPRGPQNNRGSRVQLITVSSRKPSLISSGHLIKHSLNTVLSDTQSHQPHLT